MTIEALADWIRKERERAQESRDFWSTADDPRSPIYVKECQTDMDALDEIERIVAEWPYRTRKG